jgi:hypothetical protein
MVFEFEKRDDFSSGRFNRGIDSMMILGETLRLMRNIMAHPALSPLDKQRIRLSLLQDYFLESCFLLGKDMEEIKEQVLNLELSRVKGTLVKSGVQKMIDREIYDPKLTLKINKLIFRLQQEIQKSGNYLMPMKEDDDGL